MSHSRPSWASLGLDLITLQVFAAVAQENSFAAAAARENIAISAVSRRITDMEARCGVTLFDRLDRGVQLTAAGRRLLQGVLDMFEALEIIASDLDAERDGAAGFIRLRTHMTAASGHLPALLSSFLKQHPKIEIEVEETASPDVLHSVRTGAGDVGLVAGAVHSSRLHFIPWRQDDLCVLLPKDHRLLDYESLTLEQVIDEPFINLQRDNAILRLYRQKAEEAGLTLRQRAFTTGFGSLRKMVAAGLGVAIVPTAVATPGPDAEATEMRPLNEQWAHRQLAICVRNPAKLSTACRLFISHLIGQKGRWKHSSPSGPVPRIAAKNGRLECVETPIAEPGKNKRSSSSFPE